MNSTVTRRLRLLLPLALYAVFIWRMPYSLRIWPLRVLDWVVPLVGLGAWAIVRWRRREPWPRTALDWPLLAWCVALAWSAIFSANPRASLHTVWEAWLGALILWLLVDAVRRGWGPPLTQAIFLVGGVVCLIGLAELLAWYFGWPLLPSFQQGWFSLGGLSQLMPPVMHRLGLALVNITAFSAFVALLIPPALCLLFSARKRDTRWGLALWLMAATVVLVLSASRGGFVAIGVSLPIVALGAVLSPAARRWWVGLALRSKAKRAALLSRHGRLLPAIVLGVAAVAIIAAGWLVLGRLDLSAHESGDAVRLDLWQAAVKMIRDHPLAGVGAGAYGTALRVYRSALLARDHVPTAHNLYLNTGAEAGIPGLLAGAALLGVLGVACFRRWRSASAGTAAWWQALGVSAGLVGLAAQSIFDTFVESAVVLTASLFAALILAPQTQTEPARPGRRPSDGPWVLIVAILLLGSGALAWESVGSVRFARSLALTRQGDVSGALVTAEQARDHDPAFSLYACHAGYLHGLEASSQPGMVGRTPSQQAGSALEQAVARYRECVALWAAPGWVDQLNLAVTLWHSGQQAAAREAIVQATAQTPLEWQPWLARGQWAETAGDVDDANRSFGWVLALDPELAGSPFWMQDTRASRWAEIVAAGAQAIEQMGGDTTAWRWQVGLAAGQAANTAPEIEDWLQSHPSDGLAMAWLGEALIDLQQPEEALTWLDRAVAAAPARSRSYVARGRAHAALGQVAQAEHDLRTALFIQSDCAVHLELARLARTQGDTAAALAEYRAAQPGLALVHSYDQVLYDWMAWPAPLPQASRVGNRCDASVALEWGALLEEQGRPEEAQQVYRAALGLDAWLSLPTEDAVPSPSGEK